MKSIPNVAGVILAAGEAKRMGRGKLLLPFQEGTILGAVLSAARRLPLKPIVLVLGHGAREIQGQLDLAGVVQVYNPDYRAGQSTSLKAGLAQVPGSCQGALVLLGDQPRITPGVIETLVGKFDPRRDRLVIPTCQGRRGNPVIVHQALFPLIAKLKGDVGARALFGRFSRQIHWVGVDDCNIYLDVDTPEDYVRLVGSQHQRGGRRGRGRPFY